MASLVLEPVIEGVWVRVVVSVRLSVLEALGSAVGDLEEVGEWEEVEEGEIKLLLDLEGVIEELEEGSMVLEDIMDCEML